MPCDVAARGLGAERRRRRRGRTRPPACGRSSRSRPKPGGMLIATRSSPARRRRSISALAAQDRSLAEIARAGEALDQLSALRALVAIEHRERQVLDVEGDAVAEGEHQDQRTEQREGEADAVAQQLQHLAPREGPDAADRGRTVRPGGRPAMPRDAAWIGGSAAGGDVRSLLVGRLFEIGDERVLQGGRALARCGSPPACRPREPGRHASARCDRSARPRS